jgi:hypothetical protein
MEPAARAGQMIREHDDLDGAIKALKIKTFSTKAALARAEQAISRAAEAYILAAASHEDRFARCAYVYWNTNVHVACLASILLGDKRKAGMLATILPGPKLHIECVDCGRAMELKSRYEVVQSKTARALFDAAAHAGTSQK